jgi:hypothetical protein
MWPLRGSLLLFFLPPPTFYTKSSPYKLALPAQRPSVTLARYALKINAMRNEHSRENCGASTTWPTRNVSIVDERLGDLPSFQKRFSRHRRLIVTAFEDPN